MRGLCAFLYSFRNSLLSFADPESNHCSNHPSVVVGIFRGEGRCRDTALRPPSAYRKVPFTLLI